ncbi:MAG: helix-turn-helix domain-containing protein [Erysipelotrichaceae bacterium]|nr:helix-turn-helix domain-containing protein [Erysipelotrichaceae bacterium]
MKIGEKIKTLRKKKGYSQSDLAEKLHVSAQAISKWETNQSYPDLELIPEIASLFGIMIDDLFETSKEKEFERIQNMIENQRWLTHEEFMHAEEFLLNESKRNHLNHQAVSQLADLYHFQAERLDMKAAHFAKEALRLKPNHKYDISILNNSMHGASMDWNIKNHHLLIDEYQKILKENPENRKVYFYLLDNLIEDGRLSEARKTLSDSRAVQKDVIHDFYELLIEEKQNGFNSVQMKYQQLGVRYNNEWRILISLGDVFASNEQYLDAIGYYKRAFDRMPKPRYIDFLESIAQLYVHIGDKEKAISSYQQEIQLLKDEWDVTSGESIDRLIELIEKIKQG